MQLLLRLVVTDPNGKVLTDTGQKPSKSFVIQWLEAIYYIFDGIEPTNTCILGTEERMVRTGVTLTSQCKTNAPINDDEYGIVAGTGDTAVDNEDYKLATQLTEGVGVGNITHGAMVHETVVIDTYVSWEMKRPFTNNTGSLITVKEVGTYTKQANTSPYPSHCIIRDVLGTPVDVPDKCSLTAYYTWRTLATA